MKRSRAAQTGGVISLNYDVDSSLKIERLGTLGDAFPNREIDA